MLVYIASAVYKKGWNNVMKMKMKINKMNISSFINPEVSYMVSLTII